MGLADVLKEKTKELVQEVEAQAEQQVEQFVEQGKTAIEQQAQNLQNETGAAVKHKQDDLTSELIDKAKELLKAKE